MTSLPTFLLSNQFVWIWCAAIVAYLLLCAVAFGLRTQRLLGSFRSALDPLRSIASPREFASELEHYSETVRELTPLRDPWMALRRTLLVPSQGEIRPVRSTTDIGHYLHDGSLIAGNVRLSFYASVPGHLTALGILGTFIGLAAGIGEASPNIQGNARPDLLLEALSKLLSGASLAFGTSIAGLGASLVFLVGERWQVSRMRQAQHEWVGRLEALIEPLSLERLAYDQLEYAKEQTKQLKGFNDELRFSIETALEEKVAGSLRPVLERVDASLQGLRADRQTDATAAIEAMIERFLTAMNERTSVEFGAVASAMTSAADELRASAAAVSSELGQAGSSVSAEFGNLLTGLRRTLERLDEAGARLNSKVEDSVARLQEELSVAAKSASGGMLEAGRDAAQAMTESAEGFRRGMGELERAAEGMHRNVEEVQLAAHEMASVRTTIADAHRHLEALVAPARELTQSVRQSSEQLTAAWRDGRELVGQIRQAVVDMSEQQRETAGAWQDYRARFENIDRSLREAFTHMSQSLDSYTAKTKDFAEGLDKHSANAIGSLSAVINELEGTLEELLDLLPKVKTHVQEKPASSYRR